MLARRLQVVACERPHTLPASWPAFNSRLPMTLTLSRSNAMAYRAHEIRYDTDEMPGIESEFVRESSNGKQYGRRRSATRPRRRTPKSARPGCGIAGRGNKRWAW